MGTVITHPFNYDINIDLMVSWVDIPTRAVLCGVSRAFRKSLSANVNGYEDVTELSYLQLILSNGSISRLYSINMWSSQFHMITNTMLQYIYLQLDSNFVLRNNCLKGVHIENFDSVEEYTGMIICSMMNTFRIIGCDLIYIIAKIDEIDMLYLHASNDAVILFQTPVVINTLVINSCPLPELITTTANTQVIPKNLVIINHHGRIPIWLLQRVKKLILIDMINPMNYLSWANRCEWIMIFGCDLRPETIIKACHKASEGIILQPSNHNDAIDQFPHIMSALNLKKTEKIIMLDFRRVPSNMTDCILNTWHLLLSIDYNYQILMVFNYLHIMKKNINWYKSRGKLKDIYYCANTSTLYISNRPNPYCLAQIFLKLESDYWFTH